MDCPHCGHRHFDGSASQTYCREYYRAKQIIEEMKEMSETWSPEGTTEDPFKGLLTDFWQQQLWNRIRYLIIRRDKSTCQDCGLVFKDTIKEKASYFAGTKISFRENGQWYEETHIIRPGESHYHMTKDWFELEVHHIIPRSKGGSHHPRNLKCVCDQCHDAYTADLHRDNGKARREEKRVRKPTGVKGIDEYGRTD